MSSIKWELEDLSFFYLEPDAYQRIARMVAESREVRERYLAETIKTLTDELNRIGLEDFQINGRSKHYWSIYQKMKRKGKEFSEIYDLVALRVITHSVRDCYSTLGAVHTLWHPMPGRFKDYIAMPKVNNYQSLHTTVIGPTARPLEIQIRTYEMHEQAEYGIAAHWLYKKSGGSSASKTNDAQRLDDQINWLKHSLDWAASDEITDAKEYLHSLKVDLFDQEIFVFTPKGEVMALRAGSTPLDFAYAVHTEVGNHCVGAKINGAVAPLTHEIKTGDRVEILTNKSSKPSRDWLKIVKTPSAKSKIRRYFAAATKDDDAAAGRDILAKDLRKRGYGISTPRSTRALTPWRSSLTTSSSRTCLPPLVRVKSPRVPWATKSSRFWTPSLRSSSPRPRPLPSREAACARIKPQAAKARQERQQRYHRQRREQQRPAGPSGALLQSGDGRRHRRFHHARSRRFGSSRQLPQRQGSYGASRAHDRSGVGRRCRHPLPGRDRGRVPGSYGLAQGRHHRHWRCGRQYPSAATSTNREGIATLRFMVEISDASGLDPLLASISSVDSVYDARRLMPGEGGAQLKRRV